MQGLSGKASGSRRAAGGLLAAALLLPAALALLFAGAGASPAAAVPEIAGERAQVTGTVRGVAGRPLAGAIVSLAPVMDDYGGFRFRCGPGRLWAEPVASAATGADGRYALAAPAGRRWRVIVEHPDRAPHTRRLEPLYEDRELEPVELLPARTLEVRVRGADGRPVAGARVMAHAVETAAVQPWPASWSAASTDPSGWARLQVEDAGPWRVEVVADGLPPVEVESDGIGMAEIALVAPSRLDLRLQRPSGEPAAKAVVFRPGKGVPLAVADRRGRVSLFGEPGGGLSVRALTAEGEALDAVLDFPSGGGLPSSRTLELESPRRLGVVVTSAGSGEPMAGAAVWGSDDRVEHADAGGRLELTLPATTAETSLGVAAPGHLPFSEEDQPVDVLSEDTLAVALEPASGLGGRVVDADGEPLAGVEIEVRAAQARWGGHRFGRSAFYRLARTGSDGRFALGPLPAAARLALLARGPGFGTAGLSIDPLEPFQRREGVEVVLAAGRTVAGGVVDEGSRPVSGAAVELVRERPAEGGPRRLETVVEAAAVTGDDGRFELSGVASGRAELRVTAAGFASVRWPGVEIGVEPAAAGGTVELAEVRLQRGERIGGRVVDEAGRPVSGTAVELEPLGIPASDLRDGGRQHAASDAGGGFAFADRPPGAYQLRAIEDGYLVAWSGRVETPVQAPVELVLRRGATLTGRIVDADGEPVDGARVRASSSSAGYRATEATSDRRGRFQLGGLGVARHQLDVDAEGFRSQGWFVQVAPGADPAPIEVVLERGATVAGRVTRPGGGPVYGARVVVRPAAGEERPAESGFSEAGGRFEIDEVPVGPAVVVAQRGSLEVEERIEVGPGRNLVSLVLPPGVAVSGRVLDQDGEPVAGAEVVLGSGIGAAGAWSDRDGGFTLADVAPGKHWLEVRHPEHADFESESRIAVADRPVSGLEVRLSRGATISGTVSGTVSGLDSGELAAVQVRLDRRGPGGSYRAVPDHLGRFRVDHVLPGEYDAEAKLDDVVATAAFELPEGVEELAIELQPVRGVDLRGRVVQGGRGVGHVEVEVRTDDGRAIDEDTTADGLFVLRRVPEGSRELTVRDPAGHLYRRQIEVRVGDEVVVELPSAGLSGRVVDAETGEPVVRPTVYLEALDRPDLADEPWTGRVQRRTTADSLGVFLFPAVESGRYRVRATGSDGATAMSSEIEVGQRPLRDVDLALSPTGGLALRLTRDDGGSVPSMIYALLDPDGRLETFGVEELDFEGRVDLRSVPPGLWQLWLRAGPSAWVESSVHTPGPEVSVELTLGAEMFATVPGLGEEVARLEVVLRDSAGRAPPFQPALNHHPPPSRMFDPETPFQPEWHAANLWPGEWTLEATHPDGRVWRAAFTARAGETVEVELR